MFSSAHECRIGVSCPVCVGGIIGAIFRRTFVNRQGPVTKREILTTSSDHRVIDPPSNDTPKITKVTNTVENCQKKKARAASTHDRKGASLAESKKGDHQSSGARNGPCGVALFVSPYAPSLESLQLAS